MLWAAPLLLASVTTAVPSAPVASTYDEAACADAAQHEPPLVRDADGDCSEPPAPVAPAVIDCNSPRASLWVAEMIGSCDMPRPQIPGVLPSLRAPGGAASRLCDGMRCGYDSYPLRPVGRALDDGSPFLVGTLRLPHHLITTALVTRVALGATQADGARLERPPRALS